MKYTKILELKKIYSKFMKQYLVDIFLKPKTEKLSV